MKVKVKCGHKDFNKVNLGIFFNTIFVSSHMYPENPEGTQVIVGSMNMGYISDTARNRTHNLIRHKRESIPLGHSEFIGDAHLHLGFFIFLLVCEIFGKEPRPLIFPKSNPNTIFLTF